VQGAGYPGVFPGGSSTGVQDIGAVRLQRQPRSAILSRMKISLAGPSYTSKSVVAAAQKPSAVSGNHRRRRRARARRWWGVPAKFFFQLTPNKIRCLWAGGRLFAIGNKQSEITESAAIATLPQTVAEFPNRLHDRRRSFRTATS
jgi:hypothetical protein